MRNVDAISPVDHVATNDFGPQNRSSRLAVCPPSLKQFQLGLLLQFGRQLAMRCAIAHHIQKLLLLSQPRPNVCIRAGQSHGILRTCVQHHPCQVVCMQTCRQCSCLHATLQAKRDFQMPTLPQTDRQTGSRREPCTYSTPAHSHTNTHTYTLMRAT